LRKRCAITSAMSASSRREVSQVVGTTRMRVREALLALEAERLVVSRSDGRHVTELSGKDVRDLHRRAFLCGTKGGRENASNLCQSCKVRSESWDQTEAWCTAEEDSPEAKLVLATKEVAIELSSCSFRCGQPGKPGWSRQYPLSADSSQGGPQWMCDN